MQDAIKLKDMLWEQSCLLREPEDLDPLLERIGEARCVLLGEASPADKTTTLVFYCSDPQCGASRFAAARAKEMGYANVFVMPAGIRGWRVARKPTERG